MIDPVLRCAHRRFSRICLTWGWSALLTLACAQAHSANTAAASAVASAELSANHSDALPTLPHTPPMGHSDLVVPAANPSTFANSTPPSLAWQRLSKRQKQALAPLASSWDTLTPVQQQKWLKLSRGFLRLSDEEQITLHARMSDWAALSPKQRNQARFHFNSTQKLPIDDKLAKWEVYQQLSDDDKRQLSSGPKPPLKSTARSNRPPSPRLITPPVMPAHSERAIQRIAPAQAIDPQTLLPLASPAARGARQ
jgi:hypothetical protein